MKKLVLALSFLVAFPAIAGKTQVNQDLYRPAGKTGNFYGRSDGIYQDQTSKGLTAIVNGKSAQKIGPAFYEDFTLYGADQGISQIDLDGTAVSGDTEGVLSMLQLSSGLKLIAIPLDTETILPVMTAAGLDITGDLTATEGWEVGAGYLGASGRPFEVGGDPAFKTCATLIVADKDGPTSFTVGFRRQNAFAATTLFTDQTDYAVIGTFDGDIKTATGNDGTDVLTDTTDDQAITVGYKYCVLVSAAGLTTYTVNGAAPTTTVSFTFDDGDMLIPFIRLEHSAQVSETSSIANWEVSYQE